MKTTQAESYSQQLKKHKNFISKFKLFPQKTRKIIYASLLRLPMNHEHFLELTKPYKQLSEHTPNRQTAFIVNALTKLYPSLGNQWLPGLIYPFVKLFQQDSIMCFQSALTFLLNWYQPIFQNYPNPSKRVIGFASKFLKKLEKKVTVQDYTLSAILNPMILVCLTDVLNRQDTLQLLDFLVTNPYSPEYFLCAAIAIVERIQDSVCKLQNVQKISIALRKEKKLDIQEVIKRIKTMAKQNQKQLRQIYSKSMFPLSQQRYPVYQFIKMDIKRTNNALQKAKNDQMIKLNERYLELEQLLNYRMRQGSVANSQQVHGRYEDLQGQTIQYLNTVKKEHQMKLKALKEIQEKFKRQIQEEQDYVTQSFNEKNFKIIERRGRLQKQILKMEQQARKIRELEEDLVRRIHNISQIKRDELLETNKKLSAEQRSQQLYLSY